MNKTGQIRDCLRSVIHGRPEVVDLILVALCSNGHVLIEDVPGVGKTTLAKGLARLLDGAFHRIQFTPDLLPTDILGGMIYSPKSGEFSFRQGAVFCNVLLADEINRASPRTQAALLEAMNERQVTIEGVTYPLPEPFIVIATQNPIEHHGTYPLPEAELDRFSMQMKIGYPEAAQEVAMVLGQRERHPIDDLRPVASAAEIVEIQKQVRQVAVDLSVVEYMADLVRRTRQEPRLQLGGSPRATLILYRTAQALAYLRARDYVVPDDVKELFVPVLAHRVMLDTKTRYSGVAAAEVVEAVLDQVAVPV